MQNTTRPTVVALESINPEILIQVSGGCHKKRSCASSSASATAVAAPAAAPIMQVLQLAAPPQAQPAPAPQALPPQEPVSYGPEVSTSVSINGQPA